VKNKVAPPFRMAEFDIMNVGGISRLGGLLDVAVDLDIVEKSGAFYKYKAKVLGQGREAVKMFLKEKQKLVKEIEDGIWKKEQQKKESQLL